MQKKQEIKDKCIENKENSNCSWEDFSWLKRTQFVKASVKVTMHASVKASVKVTMYALVN